METIKLLVLLMVNLGALVYLVFCLFKKGNSYPASLRIAWSLILSCDHDVTSPGLYYKEFWVLILKKTWWMTTFILLFVWITSRESLVSFLTVFWFLIHFYWYSYTLGEASDYQKTITLKSNWGLVFTEIVASSGINHKSLAELDLRKRNLLVLAIEREDQIIPFPKGMETLEVGDRVVVFGDLTAYRTIIGI